jgi:hypothetical protein
VVDLFHHRVGFDAKFSCRPAKAQSEHEAECGDAKGTGISLNMAHSFANPVKPMNVAPSNRP